MTKKIVIVLFTVMFFVFGAVNVFASENIISSGDEVRLVYTIEDVRNVAGVSFETVYNSEYLKAENIVCTVSGSESNIANLGEIKWNFLVYSGMDFNGDDVVTVTFKVLKPCTIDDLGIKYNCSECFNPDLQKISDNPNSLFSVRAIYNDREYVVNTIGSGDNTDIPDSENTSDSDINNTVLTDSDTEKTVDTDNSKTTSSTADTNKTKNTDTDKSSNNTVTQNKVTVQNISNSAVMEKTSYTQNVSNTAVDTSDSRNYSVIVLLMILSFSAVIKNLRKS